MSDDDIKPGDRFERVGCDTYGAKVGVIFTAKGIFLGHSWDVEESVSRGWTLGDPTRWRRLPRIEAPAAVKAGDVVRDPALLQVGMYGHWADDMHPGFSLAPPFGVDHGQREIIKRIGIVVTALPEPPKAEAPCIECGLAGRRVCRCDEAPPAPARCKSPCTPLNPCRTPGVCPAFMEEQLFSGLHVGKPGEESRDFGGISPDALPPARASSYVPKCAELAGWGSWDGRQRK